MTTCKDFRDRKRCQTMYPLVGITCQVCGKVPATNRHHRNRVLSDNDPDNILFCCCKCHAEIERKLGTWPRSWILTDVEIDEIKSSNGNIHALAAEFGISVSYAEKIWKGTRLN